MKTFKLFNFNRRTAMVQAEGCTAARQKIGVNPRTTSIIGRFASVLCIILIMLFTLGVGQMWGWGFSGDNFIYFQNKGSWNDSGKMLFIGKSNYSSVYSMSAVTGHTSLWVVKITNAGWSDATYMAVAGGGSVWGSGSWGSGNRTNATHYTNTYTSGVDASNNQRYILIPASGDNNAALSLTYLKADDPNYTITVKAKVSTDGGSTFSEKTSPATLSASSKRFTAFNSCNESTSLSSGTITCGYLYSTTLTAPSTDPTGFTWVGWYNSSGTQQTTSKTLTINPTADATYYAYYTEKRYSVTVSNDGNGTVSPTGTVNVCQVSGTQLTATPNTNYAFVDWTISGGGISPTSSTTNPQTFTATTTGGTIRANFAPQWTLKGGDSDDADDDDAMGNWETFNNFALTSGTTMKCTLALAAKTTYSFKVYDRKNDKWYGNTSAFVGQTSSLTMATGKGDCHITTAKAGNYIFTFDNSAKTLTVTFPTETHPSTNYIYFKNTASWSTVYAHMWNATHTADAYPGPALPTMTFNGGTYYYAAIGSETTVIFGNNNDSRKTGDLSSANTHTRQYYEYSSSSWKNFTVSISYKDVGNTAFSGTHEEGYPTIHTYGTSTTLDSPTKDNYTFDGWFQNSIGTGSSVSTISGTAKSTDFTLYAKWTEITYDVIATKTPSAGGSVTPPSWTAMGLATGGDITATPNTGYTFGGWAVYSGSGYFGATGTSTTSATANTKFRPTSNNTTIRATFTPITYTITLDGNEGTDGEATVNYDADALTSITHASRAGYSLNGYFTASEDGSKVINADGSLNNVEGWVSGGFWIKTSDGTLYAQWTENIVNYAVTYDVHSSGHGTLAAANTSTSAAISSGDEVVNGTGVTFTASPSTGYTVDGWFSNEECTSPIAGAGSGTTYSTTITAATSVYVKFKEQTWSVAFAAGTGGSVTTPNSTPKTVGQVTGISIAATPSSGYSFNRWTSSSGGSFTSAVTTNSNTFKPTANTTVTASFTETMNSITINGGTAASTTAGVATTGSATAAAPAAGKKFTGWTLGDGVSLSGGALTDRTINFTATQASSVTANYADRAGVTMYFAKPISKSWSTVYAYAWKSSDGTVYNAAYPGVELSTTTVINGITYHVYQYYTETDGIGGAATGNSAWDRIVFGDNNDARKTGNLTIADGHYYLFNSATTGSETAYAAGWYIKGTMNSWGESEANAIIINSSTNTGSVTLSLTKDTKYEFKVYSKVDNEMWSNSTALGNVTASVPANTLYKLSSDPNVMNITPSITGAYKFTVSYANTTTPKIAIDYPNQYIHGSWNDTDDPFDEDGCIDVDLTAGTYTFKIKYNNDTYGCDATMTSSSYDYYFYSNVSKPCTLTVVTAGKYSFGWDGKDKKVSVVFPADQGKAFFEPESYIYFNMSNNTSWQTDNPAAKFWFKNALTGIDVDAPLCLVGDTLDKWVYYAQVPDNERVGRVQMNRTNSTGAHWNHSIVEFAGTRSSVNQNCLTTPSSGWDDIDLTWGTYCPPMSSATLTHDASTVTYGGNGESSTPYLVATSSSIKVSAESESALNDANMTAHYQFKKAGSADGDESATATHTYTASGTNGTTQAMTVVARNNYNSTYGTASPASNAIYYKACTPYSVTHTLVGVTTTTGKTGASATVYGAVYNATFAVSAGYDMPTTVTVTIGGSPATLTTDYTWNSSTGALQIKANKITGNVVITVHGVAKALTFTGATNSWSTTSNWSPACVPTIEHDVTINKPAVVDIEHAAAKSIVLNQYSGNTGKLTIQANKGLEVEGTIRVKNKAGNTVVTTPKDLILQSSSAGNASLIFANTALDDRKDSATVYMYSKAEIPGSGHWNWQYIGLPFESANATYTYYGSYIHKFISNAWAPVANGETLYSWQGYSITNNSATTYEMEGELVSTTDDVEIEFSLGQGKLLGNSWTAPINIESFTTSGEGATFTSTPATIYLFNTGNTESGSVISIINTLEPGQYISIPVKSASSIGIPYIAPMQGFWISADDKAGSVTLKYNELVRPASERAIVAGAMRAPKREQTEHPQVMKIFATGARYSDRVTILSREDFSRGFDNGWDGERMTFCEEAPSIYVINGQGSYDAVSSIPEYEGTVIGFRSGTNNMATISFDYDGEETLYLNDLRDQISALISNENTYEFSTSANDDEARFIISATPIMSTPTAVENNTTTNENKVQKIIFNDRVYIIRNGRMYDATGVLCK